MKTTAPGTISKLIVSNVKRVKRVVIEPDPDDPVVLIRGENAQGKSSILDAIKYAYGGKACHPPRVIRDGASEAFVEVDTPELQVVRKWDAETNSTVLEVRAADGEKKKSPQAVLDQFYSDVAMQVEAFMHLTGPEQRALLSKATGVDTSLLDAEHDKVFAERTETGRELKAAQARFAAHKQTEEPPAKSDTASLVEEQKALNAKKTKLSTAREVSAAAERRVTDAQRQVKTAEAALKAAQENLALAQKKLADVELERGRADNEVEAAEEAADGVDARLAEIATALQHASAVGAAHARWEERCRLAAEVDALQAKHDSQDKRIAELRAQVEEIIASAKFPVPGLGFTQSGVKFNGLPFEQASQAEQLRCSVGIAVALSPQLRIILIRQGSLFDKKSMRLLRELCREYGMQAWVEAVGDEGPATVVIVDGQAAA